MILVHLSRYLKKKTVAIIFLSLIVIGLTRGVGKMVSMEMINCIINVDGIFSLKF